MLKAKIIGAHPEGNGGQSVIAIDVTGSVGVNTVIDINGRQFEVLSVAVERDDFMNTDVIFAVRPA